jgi:hypothetical protein
MREPEKRKSKRSENRRSMLQKSPTSHPHKGGREYLLANSKYLREQALTKLPRQVEVEEDLGT